MSQDISVVLLAAGKGTRMRSKKTKVLHSLAGIPLAAHPIHTALELEATQITVIVGHQAQAVEESLRARFSNKNLEFVLQDKQLGTGHAVMCAKKQIEKSATHVLILYGDVPLLTKETCRQLLDKKIKHNATVSMISFQASDPTGYGRVLRNEQCEIIEIREHRDCTEQQLQITECNSGIYCVDRDFLLDSLQHLKAENDQGEYYLTDIVKQARAENKKILAHHVEDPVEVMGVNDKLQLSFLENVWLDKRRKDFMRHGVTMRLPETIFLEYDVSIAEDVEIAPGATLSGETIIGANCKIGAGSMLMNAKIRENTILPPNTILENTV